MFECHNPCRMILPVRQHLENLKEPIETFHPEVSQHRANGLVSQSLCCTCTVCIYKTSGYAFQATSNQITLNFKSISNAFQLHSYFKVLVSCSYPTSPNMKLLNPNWVKMIVQIILFSVKRIHFQCCRLNVLTIYGQGIILSRLVKDYGVS